MEMKRQEEVQAKHAMSDQEKLMRDQKKYAHDIRMQEINKEIFEKQKLEEIKRREKQQKMRQEREEEAIRKDAERRAKVEQLEEKLKDLQKRRKEETTERMKIMEEKSAKIKQVSFLKE